MKALILDTETTGLIANHIIALNKQPEIIEFYASLVDLKSGKLLRAYETLVKPKNYPMTAITIKETKTRLSNDMLKDAPPFADVAEDIRSLIEKAPLVIAHNASFDQEMIDIEFERMKGKPLKWPRTICTVEQTTHLKGVRLSLTRLYETLFDEKFPDAHRAKADVVALIRCCVKLYKDGALL